MNVKIIKTQNISEAPSYNIAFCKYMTANNILVTILIAWFHYLQGCKDLQRKYNKFLSPQIFPILWSVNIAENGQEFQYIR